ncbi:SDR family NAD(P)-dependent oxidoreductase [Burkholderia contaminans]|nr:SDR family NAD(P)-dependent oxidoreductase [Burkholderia contaminans]
MGRIDILVNNAGLALDLAPYQDYEELDMLTMLDTNVKGLMAVTRCFLPAVIHDWIDIIKGSWCREIFLEIVKVEF